MEIVDKAILVPFWTEYFSAANMKYRGGTCKWNTISTVTPPLVPIGALFKNQKLVCVCTLDIHYCLS